MSFPFLERLFRKREPAQTPASTTTASLTLAPEQTTAPSAEAPAIDDPPFGTPKPGWLEKARAERKH